ncbi:MAG: SDR family oxidoreductase [Pseudomonadota bacterium]|nr:SDR family oxidoreductase [Pseudomonadota bacterium]
MKKILVTGGAGYVGAVLVRELLHDGYEVTVLDLMIYGEKTLPKNEGLSVVKGDIRNTQLLEQVIPGHDSVIHLACISNDPSFELNPKLGQSINLDAFEPLVRISRDNGVQRFIYASSSSVYGVKEEQDVHEDMLLEPLTDYSRFKADCEQILSKFQSDNFTTVTIRPATVCGYSPRQRLDVVVNILSNLAYHKRKITIFGGSQMRPNIHIKDMVKAYQILLTAPASKIAGNTFNAGYENHSVDQLGQMVLEVMGPDVEMVRTPTDDNRSYHVSSSKIKAELGFEPDCTISDAVSDLKAAFSKGLLHDPLNNEMFFNIKRMQSIELE